MLQWAEVFWRWFVASRSIKNRPGIKKKHPSTGLLVVLCIILAVIVAGGVGVFALCSSWLQDLPDYEDADAYNTIRPTVVYADDGQTKLAEFQLENRDPVELDQINPYVLQATIATEDERFYEHGGIDLPGIARALVVNITGSGQEGASTITQQFVRNTILANEMTDISLKRKVREAFLSVKLEEQFSKDEILLMYLNTINYGSHSYGIQAASQRYFSKDAADLTLVEAATLVGIPQSPTYNNPIDNEDNCLKRRNVVLQRMLSNGYISQDEYDAAVATPLQINPKEPSNDGILMYPYFSSYIRDTLMNDYARSYDEIFKGGLTVYTTLNLPTQQAAEEAAAQKEETLADELEVAMTAVDPDTGYIRAMVGGKDYYADQWNLATQGARPAGSSFKTFTLIAALEAGISPSTMVNCSTSVKLPGMEKPVSNIFNINYGTRSMERAFAVSSNTGFTRLISTVGPESVVEVAHRMGIKSELSPYLALTLGVDNVSTLEMAGAYATIANGGTRHDTTGILKVLDRKGNVIIDNTAPEGEQALTPEIAHAAEKVMESVIYTSEGTGTDAVLPNGQIAAGKTGTSEDFLDIWFCGITPQLSVAIRIGDRENKTSAPQSLHATDVFSNFLGMVLDGQPLEDFPQAGDPPYGGFDTAKLNGGASSSDSSKSSDEKEESATPPPTETAPEAAVPPAGGSTPEDDTPTPPPSGGEGGGSGSGGGEGGGGGGSGDGSGSGGGGGAGGDGSDGSGEAPV